MGKILKWILRVLGALVGLIVLAVLAVFIISGSRVNKTYLVDVSAVEIPTDDAAIERGEYLVKHVAVCAACHEENLGGGEFVNDPSFIVLYTANLTDGEGGVGATYTDEDWVRTLRHGVQPDGTSVIFMPSQNYRVLSDEDLGAILAYVKSQPPVDSDYPDPAPGPLGRLFLLMEPALLPASLIDQNAAPPAAPEQGVTPEYGAYLVSLGTCRDCHGPELNGAPPLEPGGVPGANLTQAGEIADWSEDDFIQTLRTGITPDGTPLTGDMAETIDYYGGQTDDDLAAIYAYLSTLPPAEDGF